MGTSEASDELLRARVWALWARLDGVPVEKLNVLVATLLDELDGDDPAHRLRWTLRLALARQALSDRASSIGKLA